MAIKMDDLVAMLQQLQQQGGSTQDFFKQLIQGTQGQTNPLLQMLTGDSGVLQQQQAAQQDAQTQSGAAVPQVGGPNPYNVDQVGNLPDFTSEGLTPDAMAALMGRNIDKQSSEYDAQGSQLMRTLASRGILGGGESPGSGLAVDPLSQLASLKAQANAGAVRDAILANQDQLFKNRTQLSLPMRQQVLQGQLANQNANLQGQISSNTLGQEAQKTNAANELARRQSILQALQTGTGGVNSMTSLINALNGPLSSYVTGVGIGAGQQNQATSNQVNAKQSALQNDVATGPMSVVGPLVGAAGGVAGAYLGGLNKPTPP